MRAKSPLEKRLIELAEPVAGDLGFDVVRVRVSGGGGAGQLQIMAERADGAMSAQECATLSRALSAVFDVEDPFPGEWALEVSSPGIDRPLTTLAHFARWEGFAAKVELDRLVEGRKRFRGVLDGVEDDVVLISLDGENDAAASIPFAWIADAKLILTDALVAEDLKRRGDAPADAGAAAQEEEA